MPGHAHVYSLCRVWGGGACQAGGPASPFPLCCVPTVEHSSALPNLPQDRLVLEVGRQTPVPSPLVREEEREEETSVCP